jgi:hypothetical protein
MTRPWENHPPTLARVFKSVHNRLDVIERTLRKQMGYGAGTINSVLAGNADGSAEFSDSPVIGAITTGEISADQVIFGVYPPTQTDPSGRHYGATNTTPGALGDYIELTVIEPPTYLYTDPTASQQHGAIIPAAFSILYCTSYGLPPAGGPYVKLMASDFILDDIMNNNGVVQPNIVIAADGPSPQHTIGSILPNGQVIETLSHAIQAIVQLANGEIPI